MNRAEKLAYEFKELLDKLDTLTAPEIAEVRQKVGWPARTKLYRVTERDSWNEKNCPEVDKDPDEICILRIPEMGSEAKRQQLREACEKRGISWEDLSEFVFFHVRPEWYESKQDIPEGEHKFIGEVLFDDVISVHLQYDRAKLIKYLEDVVAVAIATDALADPKILNWIVFRLAKEHGENFARQLVLTYAIFNNYQQEDDVQFIRIAAPMVKESLEKNNVYSAEDIRFYALEIENGISAALIEALQVELRNFFISTVNRSFSKTSALSSKRFKQLAFNPIRFVRPRSPGEGGDTRAYDPWEGRLPEYRKVVDEWCELMEYIETYAKARAADDWRRMIKHTARFKELSHGRDKRQMRKAIALVYLRMRKFTEAKKLGDTKRITACLKSLGPVGLVCDFAIRVLKIRKLDRSWYPTDWAIRKYRTAGGIYKQRKGKPFPGSKSKK